MSAFARLRRLLSIRVPLGGTVRRFGSDTRGTTAIEFGMVIGPFLVLVLGITTIGIQFLTSHYLEYGVEAAGRKLRTGEAQKAGMTLNGFRQLFCEETSVILACDTRLVIHIKSSATFAGLMPVPACVTNGALTPSTGSGGDSIRTKSGGASNTVVVTACYDWEFGRALWGRIWDLISPMPTAQGKTVLSAATAFRSEPFE